MIAALIAFGALFQQLGFVICSLALLLFLMTVVDPVSPKLSIPIALVASVGVWYVLEKVLLVQLPKEAGSRTCPISPAGGLDAMDVLSGLA